MKLIHLTVTLALLATSPIAQAAAPPQGMAELVATLLPQVVNISLVKPVKNADGTIDRRNAIGSGFILDSNGTILTNRHVTDDAIEITVVLNDRTRLRASLIYRSPDLDIAVLAVSSMRPLTPVRWGDSDRMRQGDPVIAIGNPLGYGFTVTSGIVSARDRDIKETDVDSFIQVDAAINPGNSGGPLFNLDGEVIGMNTALVSPGEGGSAGLGFSIPGNDVQFVVNQLRQYGRVRLGFVGVNVQEVTDDMADAARLAHATGVIVASLQDGKPAMRAGLRQGDIILRANGDEIPNLRRFTRIIAGSDIGDTIPLLVHRDGHEMTIPVVIDEAPSDPSNRVMMATKPEAVHITRADLGIELGPITDAARRAHKLAPDQPGMMILSVMAHSFAAERGFAPGDILLRVQQTDVTSIAALEAAASGAKREGRNHLLVLISDSRGIRWIVVPTPSDG